MPRESGTIVFHLESQGASKGWGLRDSQATPAPCGDEDTGTEEAIAPGKPLSQGIVSFFTPRSGSSHPGKLVDG